MITTKKELDETDKKIIRMVGDGLTVKEIAYKINMNKRAIEYRISCMKLYFGCKSLPQLILTLGAEIDTKGS